MSRKHLAAVWNPIYGPNVMEMHLRLLLERSQESREGRCHSSNVCVWWGKVRSPSRSEPLPHLHEILALDVEEDRDDPGPETHLYLTDYDSLYVAHLGQITDENILKNPEEKDWVPRYYSDNDLVCDCWFLLWDIRRLVSKDTVAVVHELRKLRNTRHSGHPVSIYGGMVDLPLIVHEAEPERFFDAATRDSVTEGSLWAEFDAERSGTGAMERELRENLFGDRAWEGLDPAARVFLSTGEKIYRDHAGDPGFDYSPVLVEYSKALEVQCNRLLGRTLRGAPTESRCINLDGRSVDLGNGHGPLTLNQLHHAIKTEHLAKYLMRSLDDGSWLANQLPYVLGSLAEHRNMAAHSGRIERKTMNHWREQLLGIGCHGHLERLGRVTARDGSSPAGQ